MHVSLPALLSSTGQAVLRVTVIAAGLNCSSVLHSRQMEGKFPSFLHSHGIPSPPKHMLAKKRIADLAAKGIPRCIPSGIAS